VVAGDPPDKEKKSFGIGSEERNVRIPLRQIVRTMGGKMTFYL